MTIEEYYKKLQELVEKHSNSLPTRDTTEIAQEYAKRNANLPVNKSNANDSVLTKVGWVAQHLPLGIEKFFTNQIGSTAQSSAVGFNRAIEQRQQEQNTMDTVKNYAKNLWQMYSKQDPISNIIYKAYNWRDTANEINNIAQNIYQNDQKMREEDKKNGTNSFLTNLKSVGTALGGASSYANQQLNPFIQTIYSGSQYSGHIAGEEASEFWRDAMLGADKWINSHADKWSDSLAQQGANYGRGWKIGASASESIGEMTPGIILNGIGQVKGIPEGTTQIFSLGGMGASAKGQSFREGLRNGMDIETAERTALARGSAEVGSEFMFNGSKVFKTFRENGIEDTAKNYIRDAIENRIKAGTMKAGVGKALTKAGELGIDMGSEAIEEYVTDIYDKWLERGTTDPNSKYTLDDFIDTTLSTFLSTAITNTTQDLVNKGIGKKDNYEESYNNELKNLDKNIQDIANSYNKELKDIKKERKTSKDEELQEKVDTENTQKSENYKTSLQGIINNLPVANEVKERVQGLINSDALLTEDSYIKVKENLKNIAKENGEELQRETYNQVQDQINQLKGIQDNLYNQRSQENFTDRESRKFYAQQMNQSFSDDTLNMILDAHPVNRNGKRTVGQYKDIARQYGEQMAVNGLNFEQVRQNTVRAWQELLPSKNITRYDNQEHTHKGFERLNTDTWSKEVYSSYKQAMSNQINDRVSKLEKARDRELESIAKNTDTVIDTINDLDINLEQYREEARNRGLIDSAKEYNIDPSYVSDIQELTKKRGIVSYFDASKFNDSQTGSYWTYEDGVPKIIFNPKASHEQRINELAIHEFLHDLRARNEKASQRVYDLVLKKLDKNSKPYQNLYNTYVEDYSNSERNKLLKENSNLSQEELEAEVKKRVDKAVEEEAVAKILQKQLRSQESINRLVESEPSIARNIYNAIIDFIDTLTGHKIEKLYWTNVANRFEQAFNSTPEGYSRRTTKNDIDTTDSTYNKLKDTLINKYNGYDQSSKLANEVAVHVDRSDFSKSEEINNLLNGTKNNNVTQNDLNNSPVAMIVFGNDGTDYYVFENRASLEKAIRQEYGGFKQFDNYAIVSASGQGEYYLQNERYAKTGKVWKDANGYDVKGVEVKGSNIKNSKSTAQQDIDYTQNKNLQNEVFDNYRIHDIANEIGTERYKKFYNEHKSDFNDWNNQNVQYKIENGNVVTGIYNIGDNLVKLTTNKEGDNLFIEELYVEKQKQGAGTKVVDLLKDYTEKAGLSLDTFDELSKSKGFWDKVLRTENKQTNLPTQQQDNNYATNKDYYNSKPKEGTIRLYTNTASNNIESILKDGLKVDKAKELEYEGKMTWFETRPDLKGYGGTTIAVDVPSNISMEKLNGTQYGVYEDISPENIVFIDKPIFNNLRTSDLQNYIDKYGKDKVLEVYDKALDNNKYISREELDNLLNKIQNNKNDDTRYSKSTLPTKQQKDNQGRILSEGQKEYFKDSKVRDDDGNLKVVYHGTNDAGFTEFNRNYNYFTDNKEIAQSYTHGNEMVDTRIPESISDAKSWLKSVMNNANWEAYIEGTDVYDIDGEKVLSYKNESDLLKNIKRDIQKQYGDTNAGGMYEGYLKIDNPVTIDANGDKWSMIAVDNINIKGINNIEEFLNNYGSSTWEEEGKLRTSTADIVSAIETAKEEGLLKDVDGIIINNIQDEGGYGNILANETSKGTDYIIFNSNQFKAKDNINPTENKDIRYSINTNGELQDNKGKKVTLQGETTADDKNLLAIHGLGESQLNGILDLGGFPVPSIAITNPDKVDYQQFGNSFVIFNKDTINPANYKNEVYDRDVWSPTFPEVDYNIDNEHIRNYVTKGTNLNYRDDIIARASNRYLDADNLKTLIDKLGLEDTLKQIKDSYEMKYLYETAISDDKYIPPMREKQYNDYFSNNSLKNFIDIFTKNHNMTLEEYRDSENRTADLVEEMRKSIKPELEEQYPDISKKDMDIMLNNEFSKSQDYDDYFYDALAIQKRGIEQIPDTATIEKDMEKVVDKKKYDKWVDDTFGKLFDETEKGIYREGVEPFYPDGRRKSFWKLHDKYNLDNIVKQMVRKDTKGSQNWLPGYGQIQAQMSKRFKSIQDIKNSENLITDLSEENKILKEAEQNIKNDLDKIVDKNDTDIFTVSELISDFASRDLTIENFRKIGERYYPETTRNVSDNLIKKIIKDLNGLKNLPTDYFEAKPQRAVGLDEIDTIVIPTNTSEEIKQKLKNKNINYIEYSDRENLQDIFKGLDEYKFSKNTNNDDENLDFDSYVEKKYGKGEAPTIGEAKHILPTQQKQTQPIMKTIEAPKKAILPTKEGTTTDQEIAKIVDKPIKDTRPEQRAWALFKANILDKGSVFEKLSFKAKNRELQAKWDSTLLHQAKGQNSIGQDRYEFKDGKAERVSKSLTSIMDEVGKDIPEFSNYMYHLLNIDRMTLDERYGTKNKPVFGDNIDANYSRQKVQEIENKHPEFKDYAQDVYEYLDANLQVLLQAGVISQDTVNHFKEMYPHYVPIKRVNAKGLAINVPLDTKRTGINSPIKKAKGGNQDIQPLFHTMADRTMQTYRASARNTFGLELKNTLDKLGMFSQVQQQNTEDPTDNENIFSYDEEKENLTEGTKYQNPTFTVFDNGEKVTFEINQDMYDALKPKNELFSKWDNTKLMKTARAINDIRRGVLTEYNPVFSLTNAIKDAQDVLLNSQHATRTYAKFPEAYAQILKKGYWYKEYIQNGGSQNSYFTDGDFVKPDSKAKSVLTLPLRAISNVNNVIEMAPRLAEYIVSREQGKSVEGAMLDASRVTTNFKAGGDVTKFLNRNGATFLNASVQGLNQNIRNIREANAKGLKGYSVLLGKSILAGLPALLLNNLIWKDDDDYKELQDYAKNNYYIIAKIGDHKFLRIPKGRTVAVIQKAMTNIADFMQNKNEINADKYAETIWKDLKDTISLASDNLAPNNPIENNIISPLVQAKKNKTWYDTDLIPTRLQNKPVNEQYDETTDELSKGISNLLNKINVKVSPIKINYLLDQYSGGVGDVLLPMSTPQAENNVLEDKFTTDSVMKSKYPGEFYDKLDELTVNRNSEDATDTDELLYKYANSVRGTLSDLYKQKREIQGSDKTDTEKKQEIEEVQEQINTVSKDALDSIANPYITEDTAVIGDLEWNRTQNKSGEYEWKKKKK